MSIPSYLWNDFMTKILPSASQPSEKIGNISVTTFDLGGLHKPVVTWPLGAGAASPVSIVRARGYG